MKPRNPYLTPAMERVLESLVENEDNEDGELVVEGREAWYGLERTNIRTVNGLLRLCLIRDHTKDGAMTDAKYRYYIVNEEGRKIVKDAKYVPLIISEMNKRLKGS